MEKKEHYEKILKSLSYIESLLNTIDFKMIDRIRRLLKSAYVHFKQEEQTQHERYGEDEINEKYQKKIRKSYKKCFLILQIKEKTKENNLQLLSTMIKMN